MLLSLIRHADAVSGPDDSLRPLSAIGRKQARQLAIFFYTNHVFEPVEVWHSPLVRARETAKLAFAGLKRKPLLIEPTGLLPEDDPWEMAMRLASLTTGMNLALVGHQPFMGALATLLLRGKQEARTIQMKTGALLVLEKNSAAQKASGSDSPLWQLRWPDASVV